LSLIKGVLGMGISNSVIIFHSIFHSLQNEKRKFF
jgi:hypothetical protein